MATPNLKLTMLGTTGSGKTVFLLGMYNTLSLGVQGYFLYTEDPDDGLDLGDAWDQLIEEGKLPPPTAEDQNKRHQFVFNHGFDTLVTVEWLDYRGGAMTGRASSAADVTELREQLAASDSIYLVFDGGKLTPWLDGKVTIPTVQKELKIREMTQLVQHAIKARKSSNLPLPSLVVVITKADLLSGPNREVGDALNTIIDNLKSLVEAAYVEGVTTLLCPVQVGNFGPTTPLKVNVSDIDPMGLHRPMIFSLMHYLSEGLGARQADLAARRASQSAVDQQIAALNQGFLAYFRGRRIAQLQDVSKSYADAITTGEEGYQTDQSLISRLAAELEGHPIIRNGKVEL